MFLKPFKTQLSTQIKWTLQDKTNWGKWPLLTEFNFTVSAALEVAILSQKLANELVPVFLLQDKDACTVTTCECVNDAEMSNQILKEGS